MKLVYLSTQIVSNISLERDGYFHFNSFQFKYDETVILLTPSTSMEVYGDGLLPLLRNAKTLDSFITTASSNHPDYRKLSFRDCEDPNFENLEKARYFGNSAVPGYWTDADVQWVEANYGIVNVIHDFGVFSLLAAMFLREYVDLNQALASIKYFYDYRKSDNPNDYYTEVKRNMDELFTSGLIDLALYDSVLGYVESFTGSVPQQQFFKRALQPIPSYYMGNIKKRRFWQKKAISPQISQKK